MISQFDLKNEYAIEDISDIKKYYNGENYRIKIEK